MEDYHTIYQEKLFHDVKNQLFIIMTISEILKSKIDPSLIDYTNKITNACSKINELLN